MAADGSEAVTHIMSEAMDDDVIAEVCKSHLFSALEADLALQRLLSLYLGKAKHDDAFALIRCAAHSDAPTSGTCL